MIAAVTDLPAPMTGAHRTWLVPATALARRRSSTPRTRHGPSARQAVRFGRAVDVMIAGEGLETILSLR